MGNSSLYSQLDTSAYASVINSTQTKKTLVSYSQHRITPKSYVTLPVNFKDRELSVNFYVIDSKQKPKLSGIVCQALNLAQQVHKLRAQVYSNPKELLD